MILRDYLCKKCGSITEAFDKGTVRCRACGSKEVRSIISKSSFILRDGGCGWERDGYSRKPHPTDLA